MHLSWKGLVRTFPTEKKQLTLLDFLKQEVSLGIRELNLCAKNTFQPAVKPRSQHLVSGIAFRWHCDLIILPLGNLPFHRGNVSHPYKSTMGKLWNIFFIQHMNQCQQSMPKKNKPLKNITTYQLVTLVFNNVLVSSFIDSLHPILGLHKLPLLRGSTFLAVKVLGDLPWRLAYCISATMSYM